VIDKRTSLGRALAQWGSDLVNDLGGPDAITTQQQAIVDLCVREKLMVDSIDAWVLTQPSLINKRKKAVLPVVQQRTQISEALVKHLAMLGLERRAKPVQSLTGYIESTYGRPAQDHDEQQSTTGSPRTPLPRDRGPSTPEETTTCS
jgi:hypothetical protein